MVNDKLSDIEIKLINATRKFVKKLNLDNKFGIADEKKYGIDIIQKYLSRTIIEIKQPYIANSSFLFLEYCNANDAETGSFDISKSKDYRQKMPLQIDKYLQEFKEILTQEIPELKHRILVKD